MDLGIYKDAAEQIAVLMVIGAVVYVVWFLILGGDPTKPGGDDETH